jgi:hypothetical protein
MSSSSQLVEPRENTVAYHIRWRAFALRRGLALVLLCSSIPVCIALYLLAESGVLPPEFACILAMIWLAFAIGAVWWTGQFRCPRCSRRYGALGQGKSVSLTWGLFDKICGNCQLAKFETGDSDSA